MLFAPPKCSIFLRRRTEAGTLGNHMDLESPNLNIMAENELATWGRQWPQSTEMPLSAFQFSG